MINLHVADYCHDCPNFEADVDRSIVRGSLGNEEKIIMCETTIRCEHREQCQKIYNYFKENDHD